MRKSQNSKTSQADPVNPLSQAQVGWLKELSMFNPNSSKKQEPLPEHTFPLNVGHSFFMFVIEEKQKRSRVLEK